MSKEKAKLRVVREGSLEQGREEAWRALITAHAAAVEGIERGLLEAGLPPLSWYDVLLELSAAPGCRLRMHELARAVVLSRSGLTRLVDRLAKAGLLRREPDPEDGRGSFAVLTEEGARRSGGLAGAALEYARPRPMCGALQHVSPSAVVWLKRKLSWNDT